MPKSSFKYHKNIDIKKIWIEKLSDVFSKVDTCLDTYTNYVKQLESDELLSELGIDYIDVECKELGIKDWIIIEPVK